MTEAIHASAPAPPERYLATNSTYTMNPRVFVAEPCEDPENFNHLAHDYHVQFSPCGPAETHLVDSLVLCDFKKRRLSLIETQVLELKLAALGNEPLLYGLAYLNDSSGPKLFEKIAREIARLDRVWFRSLNELRRLQRERRDREQQRIQESEAAAKAATPAEPPAPETAAPPESPLPTSESSAISPVSGPPSAEPASAGPPVPALQSPAPNPRPQPSLLAPLTPTPALPVSPYGNGTGLALRQE